MARYFGSCHNKRCLFLTDNRNGMIHVSFIIIKIIMSNEARFHFRGYINKENCRIWGSENPKMIIEKPLYSKRVTV